MRRITFWLGMSMAMALPMRAQDKTSQAEAEDVKGRKAWLVQTSMPEGLENPVKILSGKDVSQITLTNRLASGPIHVDADGVVRLVREVPDPANPEKTKFLTLAMATVPNGMNEALIIMVPAAKKSKTDLLFMTKVQGFSDFKGGDCLYLNLSNCNVAVEIGTAKIPLLPGTTKIYNGDVTQSEKPLPFRYSYMDPVKKKWQILSASMTVMVGSRREICVFNVNEADHVECNEITLTLK